MVTLEYIAGFFDGEGFISIQKASNRTHSGSRYWLIASVTNIHQGVLNEIQKVIGGKVLFYKNNYTKHNGCGFHYKITLYSKQAYDFLQSILPYLIVKQEQAKVAMRYQESLRHYNMGRGKMLSSEELAFQDKCYNDLRTLRKLEKEMPINA